jgi:hypothetical protein
MDAPPDVLDRATVVVEAICALALSVLPARGFAQTEVGVIPETATGCASEASHVIINMDDEDTNYHGTKGGWTGAISTYVSGTRLEFCRVNGNLFHPSWDGDYAVLQLGSTCPPGSYSARRKIQNENAGYNSGNWMSGPAAPNDFSSEGDKLTTHRYTNLYFCFFPAEPFNGPAFPNLHMPYGVFAVPSKAWLATGYVYSDDEDKSNNDMTILANVPALSRFPNIIYGNDLPMYGKNTYFLTAKVANDTCHVQDACPYPGSQWDTAHCWFGTPPAGTHAFIWANNFYYTPVAGNQCPLPGSQFDTANCFVRPIPPNAAGFIWSNMWYAEPVCRP